MSKASKIELPIEEATAAALLDARRREAVGRLATDWCGQALTTP